MKSIWMILIGVSSCCSGLACRQSPAADVETDAAPRGLKSVLVKDIPHIRQKPDFCGEACVAMYLNSIGKRIDQDYVYDQSGLDPVEGRGCYTRELVLAVRRMGFQPGRVWYSVETSKEKEGLSTQFAALHSDLAKGTPSILCMRYSDALETTEHFRLVAGYDAKTDEVLYHEPAVRRGGHLRMKRAMLFKIWPLKYEEERWTIIRIPLAYDRLVLETPSSERTNADYAQHIHQLKKRMPDKGFSVVIEKPFVVVGDDSPAMVQRRAQGTVKWAVDLLKRDYFTKNPHHILDIWLFKDKDSYDKNTEKLTGRKPTTSFGFYTRQHRALIMNIETGGGTLVHEIVHPFIESNFSECPAWFNEGLASLYEQCQSNLGHIWGLPNWRLTGLQKIIKESNEPPVPATEGAEDEDGEEEERKPPEKLMSFKELCSTTTAEFYGENAGRNYAQARYLMLYLQEQGQLVRYYHAFRQSADDDPTGYKTLQNLLGERDMDAFQQRWERWVMSLRF
jgi:hypothetical protein